MPSSGLKENLKQCKNETYSTLNKEKINKYTLIPLNEKKKEKNLVCFCRQSKAIQRYSNVQ